MSPHVVEPTLQPAGPKNDHLTPDAHTKIQGEIVRRDIPWAMAGVGVALMVITLANYLLSPASPSFSIGQAAQVLLGVVFVVGSRVVSRWPIPTTVTIWLWSVLALLAAALAVEEATRQDNAASLGYALIIMVAFAPVAMEWKPALTSMVGQLSLFTVGAVAVSDLPARLVLAGVMAGLAGMALLHLRVQSVATIAEKWEATQTVTRTDVLTGLLTRQGLLDMLEPFMGTSMQQQQRLSVTLVDLPNLGELNLAYGSNYGDEMMRATARTLGSTLDRRYLVARWPGARFVIVAVGAAPNEVALQHRLTKAIAADPLTWSKSMPVITVGSADGECDPGHFETVFQAAARRAQAPRITHKVSVRWDAGTTGNPGDDLRGAPGSPGDAS